MSAVCKKNATVGVTQNMLVAQVGRKLIIVAAQLLWKFNRMQQLVCVIISGAGSY